MKTKKISPTKIYKKIVNALVEKYPYLYQIGSGYSIKDVGLTPIPLFEKHLFLITSELNIPLHSKLYTHNKGEYFARTYNTRGHISKTYSTVELNLDGSNIFLIRYASLNDLNGFCTASKEILVAMAFNSIVEFRQFNTVRNPNYESDYRNLLVKILKYLNNNEILEVYKSDVEVLKKELEYEFHNFSTSANKTGVTTILNSISIGNRLYKDKLYSGHKLYRNDVLDVVKEYVGYLYGNKRVDNIFPIDLLWVKDEYVNKLKHIINALKANYSKEEQIKLFWCYFIDPNDNLNTSGFMIGVSLKQEISCGGKGKTAIGKVANITEEENNLDSIELMKRVKNIRQKMKVLKIDGVDYSLFGDIDKFDNEINLIKKYSAIKILDHIISEYNFDDIVSMLEHITNTCAGLGNNPRYIKAIGNGKGFDEKVQIVTYDANYKISISKLSNIEIIDKNSSNSIDITFFINDIDQLTGFKKRSKARLEIRTNQTASPQSTIELKYF